MEINSNPNSSKSVFREWLEKLQQESWQLELLISGFAIYGIYATRGIIEEWMYIADYKVQGEAGFILSGLVFIFQKGWLIFFINLIVHVILRGLWIGAIGLRYVSGEIDYDSLGYSERFTRFLKKNVGSYDDFIERLEKSCSVIFSYTFLLFLLFVSLMFFILQSVVLTVLLQKTNFKSSEAGTFFGMLLTAYFLLGILVFFDLITLGLFKRIKENSISKIYFFLYRFYGWITLSFLYRPLLYNFIDNKYTRRLFYLSVPYIFIILIGANLFEYNQYPYVPDADTQISTSTGIPPIHYDDLHQKLIQERNPESYNKQKTRLNAVVLEQFEINKSVSSFFIVVDSRFNKTLEKNAGISPIKKPGLTLTWFNMNNLKDPEIRQLETIKSKELSKLYEKRRALNKAIRKGDQDVSHQSIDSLQALIRSRELHWNNTFAEVEKNKIEELLNKYLSYIQVKIDSTDLVLDQCYFTTHPYDNDEGIRCFFNTDSLSSGLHTFQFGRKYLNNIDSIKESVIYLPFVKQ